MVFCHQSWNFTNFVPKSENFPITKKLGIDVQSLRFPTFSAQRCECKSDKRDGHGKLRNTHGKVMEKYFVKPVGTLLYVVGSSHSAGRYGRRTHQPDRAVRRVPRPTHHRQGRPGPLQQVQTEPGRRQPNSHQEKET